MSGQNNENTKGSGRVIEFPETETVQDQAAEWLARLDADDLEADTIAAFKQWLRQSPEHRQVFEKHQRLWSDMNVLARMEAPLKSPQAQRAARPFWRGPWQGVAVSLVLVLVVGVQVLMPSTQTYSTLVGEQKTIHLSDGTAVLLNTNTELQVRFSDARRTIYLSRGEAHFEVAHNPDIPFEVHAGKGRVRAVGTAFSVYLRSDDVEVVVTDGTVAILPRPAQAAEPELDQVAALAADALVSAKAPTVSAGNIVTYDRHTAEHIQAVALGEDHNKLSWHEGLLVFRGESLARVVAEVNRYTDLKIVIPSESVKAMKVGGFFKVDDIESVFEALEKGFDIHAEYVDEGLVYLVYREQ